MAAKKKTKVIKKAAKTSKPMKKTPAKSKLAAKSKSATKSKVIAKPKVTAKLKVTAKPSNTIKPRTSSQPKTTTQPTINWDDTISPLDDRLIVAPEEAPTMTAGGLHIPVTVSERPVRGKVLAKGPGRRNKKGQLRPLDVTVGDEVMYAQWSGTKIEVSGHEVLILREEDILGIVT